MYGLLLCSVQCVHARGGRAWYLSWTRPCTQGSRGPLQLHVLLKAGGTAAYSSTRENEGLCLTEARR